MAGAMEISRRDFMASVGGAAASLALPLRRRASVLDHAPRAKRIIWLFMAGAPSQLETFDEKPTLAKYEGKQVPPELVAHARYAFIRKDAKLLGPRFRFRRCGESGANVSDALPYLQGIVDKITIVRSMHTDQFNHAPGQIFMNTGSPLPGRPSLGAWLSWGLGAEARDLPAYVVLSSGGGTSGGTANWSAGFLEAKHAGVPFRSQGDPIPNLSNPKGVDRALQASTIELVRRLNRRHYERTGDAATLSRSEAYDLALRMQDRGPELADFGSEPRHVLDLYGVDPDKPSFARNCLLARRLIERGVRMVQLFHKGWDHHTDVEGGVRHHAKLTDQATTALVLDLEQRGLLDDTLVVWCGEFGRTPMVESNAALKRKNGRDHHPQAFSCWLAGGGAARGLSYGATDELGFNVVDKAVHVHDLQATVLHCLGIDHERLTYRYQGRDFRLTDVHGRVVHDLLA